MELKLYNTLNAKKEIFTPLDAKNVRIYVCGPTVYDHAHIGNARPVIVFDLLYRLLRHVYGPDHVTYARNITDVDDKINARAVEEGVPINEITARTTKQFHDDIAALGTLAPDIEPRATDHIEQMKALIARLVEKGNAYVAQGHVLFHVPSMADYGKLSKRSLDEMEAGARVEVAPYKKDPMDFVLWKPSKEGEPAWDSPCGIEEPGRPGWHIECSAMAAEHLGKTFDIHGGGVDLVFPHHENEIAQTRCGFGTGMMAQVWMHNGYLQVEGRKMSKSEGNFITLRDVLTNWNGYAWLGDALRFNMLRTHYRQPLDWTFSGLDESHKVLWDWYGGLENEKDAEVLSEPILTALCDDLNTPQAIAELHKLHKKGELDQLRTALKFLGFSADRESIGRSHALVADDITTDPPILGQPRLVENERVKELIATRNAARAAKDFTEADRLRDELAAMGVARKDGPEGTTGEVAR